MVVFSSPEASYQYDTGAVSPVSTSTLSKLSNLGIIKEEEEEAAAATTTTKDLRKATDAITENRIKLASKSLYSYKVIRPREAKPATFFVQRKPGAATAPAATHIRKAPPAAPPPAAVTAVLSTKSHHHHHQPSLYSSYPYVSASPRRPSSISVGYQPSSHYTRPYHRPPPPASATASTASYRSPSPAASYGVSLPLSVSRYPSSLTANTLVHRPKTTAQAGEGVSITVFESKYIFCLRIGLLLASQGQGLQGQHQQGSQALLPVRDGHLQEKEGQ